MELSINRATLPLDLKDETVHLRLTVAGQMRLEKKYKTDCMSILFDAANSTEKAVDVLDEALKWNGNENTITNGMDLYDALVDCGYKGMDGFADLFCKVAAVSGILNDEHAEKASSGVKKTVDAVFDHLEKADLLEEEPARFQKAGEETAE